MSKNFSFLLLSLLVGFRGSVAQLSLTGPLLTDTTEVEVSTTTITSIKGTPCFTTVGPVTECRRKRGVEEKVSIIQFDDEPQDLAPSQVFMLETTAGAPRSLIFSRPQFNPETIMSSIDEPFYDSYKFFQNIIAIAGRGGNSITIAPTGCVGPVDFSKFFSCIGLIIQNTNTVTSRFTATKIITQGYSTVTLAGCTPPFFPYPLCSIKN